MRLKRKQFIYIKKKRERKEENNIERKTCVKLNFKIVIYIVSSKSLFDLNEFGDICK